MVGERLITKRVYIIGDARVYFANEAHIGSRVERFASGDIRSLVVATNWSDDAPGGEHHIEPGDKPKIIAHLKKILRRLQSK
jgi:hypothetical protein